jgi:hypothetical protein
MTTTSLGSPAFTLDGGVLGINVIRTVGLGGESSRGSGSEGITSIFLPAEDILKAAKQAPEPKGDVKSDDSAKPDDSKSTLDTKKSDK